MTLNLALRRCSHQSSSVLISKVVVVGRRSLATSSSTTTFNINHALKKAEEGDSFQSLTKEPVTTLQGIGPKHAEELESLGLKTIQQLADYKFYHLARSITVLAQTEEPDGRSDSSIMNIHKGIDKEFQDLPLTKLVKQPIHAIKGIHPDTGGKTFSSLGVKTIADLANFKYCQRAEAIVVASRFEEEIDQET